MSNSETGVLSCGEAMNPMDTARAWAKLYEFKTGKSYVAGTQLKFGSKGTGQIEGQFLEIAREIKV